jgi:hypothetical protein
MIGTWRPLRGWSTGFRPVFSARLVLCAARCMEPGPSWWSEAKVLESWLSTSRPAAKAWSMKRMPAFRAEGRAGGHSGRGGVNGEGPPEVADLPGHRSRAEAFATPRQGACPWRGKLVPPRYALQF